MRSLREENQYSLRCAWHNMEGKCQLPGKKLLPATKAPLPRKIKIEIEEIDVPARNHELYRENWAPIKIRIDRYKEGVVIW